MTSRSHSRAWLPALTLAAFVVAFGATHLPPGNVPTAVSLNDKLMHALTYMVLGLLTRLSLRRQGPSPASSDSVVSFLIVMMYALFDEATQPIVGRTFELGDIAADTCGAFVGVFIACLMLRGARS